MTWPGVKTGAGESASRGTAETLNAGRTMAVCEQPPRISAPQAEMTRRLHSPCTVYLALYFGHFISFVPDRLDRLSAFPRLSGVERIAIKRSLESEGVPPRIEDPAKSLEIFEEILKRGALFYPESNEATQGHPRVYRIVSLKES